MSLRARRFRGAGGAVAACLCVVGATACTVALPGPGDASGTLAAQVGASSGPSSAAAPTMDTSPKSQRQADSASLAVVAISIEGHSGFDRLVVELEGTGLPGWFVSYVPSPMQETAGNPVMVAGSAYLNVNLMGMVSRAEAGMHRSTPTDISTSSSNVVDLVKVGTHDGLSQIIVGMRAARPYSVQLLDAPPRLVVDISTS